MRLHAAADRLVEDLLVFALDNEHHLAEARAVRVAERKVDDKMPLRVDGRHLLQSAEAAAHPSGHDDQRRFTIYHKLSSSF